MAAGLGTAAGCEVVGVVAGAGPEPAAAELARFVPRVLALDIPDAAGSTVAAAVAPSLAALVEREAPAYVLVGATQDGRDIAGMLSALLGWGVLVNASSVAWTDGGPAVEMSVFGGRLLTTSAFGTEHGIVTVRPNSVAAHEASAPGRDRRGHDRPDRLAPGRPGPRPSRGGVGCGPDRGGAGDRRRRAWGRRTRRVPGRRRPCGSARRGGRCDPRGRRCRLDPVQPADRPDRQDRQAGALRRPRHLRGDPAQGRDADRVHDRRGQPRPGRTDRRVRRPRRDRATCSRWPRPSRPSSGRGPPEGRTPAVPMPLSDRHPARRLRGPRRRADRRRPRGPAGSLPSTAATTRSGAPWRNSPTASTARSVASSGGSTPCVATSSRRRPSPRTSRRPRTPSHATRTRPRRCRRHPARSTLATASPSS